MAVRQDLERRWTHIDWELDDITPRMIDWFWSNMEKGYFLWHPDQHKEFYWEVPVKPGRFLGAVHVAPQRWADGTLIEPHIRFDDVASLPPDVADLIKYDHCVAVAANALFKKDYRHDNPIIAYRIHQWQASDRGVVGMSSAVPMRPDPLEVEQARGLTWAAHAGEEVGNWAKFLPDLYRLYKVVPLPETNPFFSLKVKREGRVVRYVEL